MSNPPYYILLANDGASLGHPVIQYHYADDSPLSLLPTHPDEHILVLNYDPSTQPTVQSISQNLSVTGLKLEEAPGAAASDESGTRNNTMFIIETTTHDHSMASSHGDRKSAQGILAHFKQRNHTLHRALQYPGAISVDATSSSSQPKVSDVYRLPDPLTK
ncbi:hypothetical protein M413DRAFT_439733 [Hebeloma cylindrosporum]|uniref:Uncharacterized protein n=1 Tax=Hebeloma cylindrosporum TaxID=76867 RepID=A0A0C2Z469_HEBCY|nr:hypothetical protein M413DRAFT_439733 [Hebeloma cylindrosporum h7]